MRPTIASGTPKSEAVRAMTVVIAIEVGGLVSASDRAMNADLRARHI